MTHPRLLFAVAGLLGIAATAGAQEPLTKAKALYDAAAYEEALTLLGPVQIPEAQQYKALCMLALGRPQDAAGAVELLVSASPTFEPSAEDVPPRFVSLVSDAKRKLLPTIARRTFNDARDQYKSGAREDALQKFDLVLTLAGTSPFKETTDAEDLRTLASGFIELARAAAPPKPEPKALAPRAEEQPAPAAAPPDVIQPVAIKQTIPPVPQAVVGRGGPVSSVRVQIGVDGKVVNAVIEQAAHPVYDRLLLVAAREWIFSPATMNGRPVVSEKLVSVQLK